MFLQMKQQTKINEEVNVFLQQTVYSLLTKWALHTYKNIPTYISVLVLHESNEL